MQCRFKKISGFVKECNFSGMLYDIQHVLPIVLDNIRHPHGGPRNGEITARFMINVIFYL